MLWNFEAIFSPPTYRPEIVFYKTGISAERHSCEPTQCAGTETKHHKTDEGRCNEMTTKSVNNPTKSKNRCHETIKRDDSASLHQCTSCQCDSPSVQSKATSNCYESAGTISPTISNQLKHENNSGLDQQRRRSRRLVENSCTSQGFPTPNRLSEITTDIRKLSIFEENNNTVKAEKRRESTKLEQSTTDKFSARPKELRKSRNRSSITQRKGSKTNLHQGSSLINKSSSKLKGRRKSEDKTKMESRSSHGSMSRQMSKSKSKSPYKPIRTVSSKTTGKRSSKSSSRVLPSAKAAPSDVDDLSPTDQNKSDTGVNRSSDTVVSDRSLEKSSDRSSVTHSISSKLRESAERSEKRYENQEKETQKEQYHKSHNMNMSDTQSDRSHKRNSNESTNSNRKDGKKHHQHHHHRRKSKSSASDKAGE